MNRAAAWLLLLPLLLSVAIRYELWLCKCTLLIFFCSASTKSIPRSPAASLYIYMSALPSSQLSWKYSLFE